MTIYIRYLLFFIMQNDVLSKKKENIGFAICIITFAPNKNVFKKKDI